MKQNQKKLLGVGLVVALVFLLGGLYINFREKPVEGSKEITIEVINSKEESVIYEVKTDAKYLRQAMEEADGLEFSGTDGEFGMMVDTVNSETVNYNINSSYWSFYVNGTLCNYGIDTQPIEDQDAFQIVYTIYVAE
ncbi:MAG: DUF4430 domain-containing protein [Lachnospiraceae bacterium]|nr:DUF4430 domain-containing protein [Lachnospiraceae bacterium]